MRSALLGRHTRIFISDGNIGRANSLIIWSRNLHSSSLGHNDNNNRGACTALAYYWTTGLQGLRPDSRPLRHGTNLDVTGRRYFQCCQGSRPYQQKMPTGNLERPEMNASESSSQGEAGEGGKSNSKDDFEPQGGLAHAATKGKLLMTPSRLLKLLIPLGTGHRRHVETIAILIHSQQPLSYLERLIQAEVSPIKEKDGVKRPPGVSFIARQLEDNSIRPRKAIHEGAEASVHPLGEVEEVIVGNEKGELSEVRKNGGELGTYSYLRRTWPDTKKSEQQYVRWSHATEIGDFIRDAAHAGEFIVAIEGTPEGLGQIRVTVPSFEERTHFLRMRLRKIAGRIQKLAGIKHECDALAHRGAQRVALGGFGVLAFWWCLVYKLTFETDLGWDTMEPVTYLASLSTLMGGYLWFLYHNREISYRSALDFTISARQKKLYQLKGVDLQLWESLIDEGNAIRKEIKMIAAEYDTEWDEKQDERDERVTEALRQERNQKKRNYEEDDDDDKDSSRREASSD